VKVVADLHAFVCPYVQNRRFGRGPETSPKSRAMIIRPVSLPFRWRKRSKFGSGLNSGRGRSTRGIAKFFQVRPAHRRTLPG